MATLIDTDIKNNISHIRPYLGIMLIGCIALAFGMIIYNAATDLAEAVQVDPAQKKGEGSLKLSLKGDVHYGDTLEYTMTAPITYADNTRVYVSTVCFQGGKMVYEKNTMEGESVYLYDQRQGSVEWDAKDASCSATLMYHEGIGEQVSVRALDSIGFDVKERGY